MGCSSSKEAALFCLEGYGNDNPGAFQSIHAALASGDGNEYSGGDWDNSFNPRRSCERRPGTPRFPPPRGCFNPRRSCERRLSAYIANPGRFCFNPRRSCERRRRPRPQTTIPGASFNPRRSCERRLAQRARYRGHLLVSIHAALASGDPDFNGFQHIEDCFNPRRSCERRPFLVLLWLSVAAFQSTPLLRAATTFSVLLNSSSTFQSTPLLRAATL